MTSRAEFSPLTPVYGGEIDESSDPTGVGDLTIGTIKGAKRVVSGRIVFTQLTPLLLVTADTQRRTVTIRNLGAVDLFIGGDNSVSLTNGFRMAAAGADPPLILETVGEVWGIIASGTSDFNFLAETDSI